MDRERESKSEGDRGRRDGCLRSCCDGMAWYDWIGITRSRWFGFTLSTQTTFLLLFLLANYRSCGVVVVVLKLAPLDPGPWVLLDDRSINRS